MQPVRFDLTLEPLRTHGADTLDVRGVPEIQKITLREIHFTRDNAFHETITRTADDLFRCVALEAEGDTLIPPDAIVVHAFFVIQFTGSPKPRSVLLRLPSTIKFEQDSDAPFILPWLSARGFTNTQSGEEVLTA